MIIIIINNYNNELWYRNMIQKATLSEGLRKLKQSLFIWKPTN